MRARFIPFALIVALTVGGCSGGGSGGDPSSPPVTSPVTLPVTSPPVTGSVSVTDPGPPQPSTPTVPADVPTTGPNLVKKGEKPPVMPLEATQHTQRGAVAFGKFFIRTIDWGFATMSSTYMRHYFVSACEACASFASGIDKARRLHHTYLGGRFSITTARVSTSVHADAEFVVVVTFDATSFEELDAKNRFYQADIAHRGERFKVSVEWRSDAWTAASLSVQQ